MLQMVGIGIIHVLLCQFTVKMRRLNGYNVYHASMLIRHDADGKMYLYDVIDIKKETSNPFEPYGFT